MEDKKELIAQEVGTSELNFISKAAEYCSFVADTQEKKALLFTAMNNPTYRIEEKLNTTIELTDVYAEAVQFIGDGGEILDSVRIVLIDVNGESYGCCSVGMFSALKKLMRVFGEPTWEEPIKVQPYQTPTRNGKNKIFTLRLVQ